jgi:predicted RNase H-like nuclease (RuvC/YqgF family)
MTDKEYSEYGYRGLEEVLAKEAEIKELKKEISELRMKLQEAENQSNNLMARANLPNN